jgi:hypothetical protein
MPATNAIDRRRHLRFTVPPMYSPVVVRRGAAWPALHGHAYDVSEGGVRFEVDEPLELGETISFQIDLPAGGGTVTGGGRVVRVNDELDDPGPRRAAIQIESFLCSDDRSRLIACIGPGTFNRAA